jgi:hypothetical protein
MSDHIPDPTKMISDTPRTDDAEYLSYDSEPPESLEMVDVDFARTLERELNAANSIIRQQQLLEEELIDAKGQYAALVADVVLYEDRGERIKHLEDALRRIANTDYRGNRSTESQIAFEALKKAKP